MAETSFLDDVIFPVAISRGSTGGPEWLVDIVTNISGHEERNTPWSAPLRSYDAKWAIRTKAELYDVLQTYLIAMGPLRGFRLLDWTDYRSGPPHLSPTALDQGLGTGDGTTTVFALVKSYAVGPHQITRRIDKPFGTLLIGIDGTPTGSGFSTDLATGTVNFDAAPEIGAALTWGGEFHVPVRFDGKLDQTTIRGEYGDIPSIPLRELRL